MAVLGFQKPLSKRPYLAGALFWIAYSLVAVLLRGVRWDENYEFAQVILGQVAYPEGHPLRQYLAGFFSLQTYALATLMEFAPGPLLANLLRNWLYLASSAVPVFLLGALFSGRQIVGHAAALLVLLGAHATFYSTYPVAVWPDAFSNGAVGLGYVLFALWALLDHRFRLAGLLIGLAPAIHLGQTPPLAVTATLYTVYILYAREYRAFVRLACWAVAGGVISALFAGWLWYTAEPPPAGGPYHSNADPMTLWRTYMAHHATHRALPVDTGHLVLLAAALTAAGGLLLRQIDRRRHTAPLLASARTWGLVYCLAVCAIVWGIMAAHASRGADVPFLLVGWLPYRLMNHVAPVLIPLLLAFGYDRDNRIPLLLPLMLFVALLAPILHLAAGPEMLARYVTPNAYLFFLLAGGAGGAAIVAARRAGILHGRVAFAFAAAITVLLALYHQFGAACVAAGVAIGWAGGADPISTRALQVATAALSILLLFRVTAAEWRGREHLPRTAFHREVAAYLAEQNATDAMIAVPYMQVGEQAKFGHPVLADMATLLFCGYRPELAPAVNAIFEDFYGISLDPGVSLPDRPWQEVWPAKEAAEWRALAKKYGVRYVAAPSFMRLPLEAIVEGDGRVLYRIDAPPPPVKTSP